MSIEVKVPKISEDADSGTVAEIYVNEGDTVEEGQDILALESDKASVDVPSDASGKVKSIKVSEGDEVKVGDVLLVLEESRDDDAPESDDSEEKEKDTEESDDSESEKNDSEEGKSSEDDENKSEKKPSEGDNEDEESEEDDDEEPRDESDEKDEEGKSSEKKDSDDESKSKKEKSEEKETKEDEDGSDDSGPVAPLAKKLARELGVDIRELQEDDAEKRVTREDVMAHAKKMISVANKKNSDSSDSKAKAAGQGIELPDFSQWGETERKPLSGIRTAVAKNTTMSWQNIPHVTHHDHANLTELQEFLDKTSADQETKLSMTAVISKIAVEALKQFPKFNASLDLENKEIVLKKYYHVSIAVDTESGLMMPVIKDVDQKPINKLSEELTELAEKARNQKLKPEEMKGGNFAISNLGGIGGTSFTPVIFPPQVAILGVSTSEMKPVWDGDKFEPTEMLPLSLSYDHRLIDGAEAARFLRWICEVIEQPFHLLSR